MSAITIAITKPPMMHKGIVKNRSGFVFDSDCPFPLDRITFYTDELHVSYNLFLLYEQKRYNYEKHFWHDQHQKTILEIRHDSRRTVNYAQ